MSRLQLALNVRNLEAAIAHYSKLFGAAPAKIRPGYANFAIENPPLKLVLIENPEATDSINHLGVEVQSVDEVRAEHDRITNTGLSTWVEGETTCCYAASDKYWITDPQGVAWEQFHTLGDIPVFNEASQPASGAACCAPTRPTAAACCAPNTVATASCCDPATSSKSSCC